MADCRKGIFEALQAETTKEKQRHERLEAIRKRTLEKRENKPQVKIVERVIEKPVYRTRVVESKAAPVAKAPKRKLIIKRESSKVTQLSKALSERQKRLVEKFHRIKRYRD